MIQLRKAFLIALITISFNGTSQNSIDSTLISKSIRLIQDYKACQEINEILDHRLDIYAKKVRADSITMNRADSVMFYQDSVITNVSNENYKLTEKVSKLKKRRKFWFIGGLATGLSAFLLLVF